MPRRNQKPKTSPLGTSADLVVAPALYERTPGNIEGQLAGVTVNSPADQLAAAIDAADWLLARAKAIHRLSEQAAITWIERNGPFEIGVIRYSVGYSTTTRCINIPGAGAAILDAVGGDLATLWSLLAAQPYKPASVRAVLPQSIYRMLFCTRRSGKLVCGVPEPVLKREDRRFIRLPAARIRPADTEGALHET